MVCPHEKCQSTFYTKAQLQGHLKQAHRRWPCQHPPCNEQRPPKSFSRKSDRDAHVAEKHSDTPRPKLACRRCEKPFTSPKSLKQHEDRCEGLTKRQCPECKAWVANSSDIRNHQRMHEKQRIRDAINRGARAGNNE